MHCQQNVKKKKCKTYSAKQLILFQPTIHVQINEDVSFYSSGLSHFTQHLMLTFAFNNFKVSDFLSHVQQKLASAQGKLLQRYILQRTVMSVNNSLLRLPSILTKPESSSTSIQLQLPSTATFTTSNFVTVNSISRNQLAFVQPSSGSERVIKFPVYTVNFDLTSFIAPCLLH